MEPRLYFLSAVYSSNVANEHDDDDDDDVYQWRTSLSADVAVLTTVGGH